MNGLAAVTAGQGDLPGRAAPVPGGPRGAPAHLGEEHADTLKSASALAELLTDLGEYGEALRIGGGDSRARSRQALGGEHPESLRAMIIVARTLHARGELDSARRLSDEALKANEDVLGEAHPQTLRAMRMLGVTLWAQHNLFYARPCSSESSSFRGRPL